MANPFDRTVDEGYNPFAMSGSGFNEAPAPAPPAPSYTETYQNDPYQSYQEPPAQPKAAKPAGNTFLGNSTGAVDPITGAPLNERDLEIREAELARREREIEDKETKLANGTLERPKSHKNFPPFVHIWAYHPEEDLPEPSLRFMKWNFWLYVAHAVVYLINFIGCLCCLYPNAGNVVSSVATKIILGAAFLILFVPISFEVCYFTLYNGLSQGKAMKYFCGLVTSAIWTIICAFNAIGINGGGTVGWIQMAKLFGAEGATFVGIIGLIYSILATAGVAGYVYIFILLIKYWKQEGLQNKALGEASVMAAQAARENPDVVMQAAAAANTYG